jgi:hypothetical protein
MIALRLMRLLMFLLTARVPHLRSSMMNPGNRLLGSHQWSVAHLELRPSHASSVSHSRQESTFLWSCKHLTII